MDISNFDYELPQELIAQYPPKQRGTSRLLCADIKERSTDDRKFIDIPEILDKNCFLVVNNSQVLPARMRAKKATGGEIELFFLKKADSNTFIGLCRGRVPEQTTLTIDKAHIRAGEKLKDGSRHFISDMNVDELLSTYGKIPLPPYITRDAEDNDSFRYQTVYAKHQGSVAAPTAGLHFTPEIFQELKNKNIPVVELTLHVGIGTFRPIKTADIDEHEMHTEEYFISGESAERINSFIKEGRTLVAVGTTSVRTLESASDGNGYIKEGSGETNLFIKPGYKFKIVKSMITNFHQPKSSLFVMISTFMGLDFAHECYKHAVENKYRFFSYGDAMYIK